MSESLRGSLEEALTDALAKPIATVALPDATHNIKTTVL
jgi:hypothetical protein